MTNHIDGLYFSDMMLLNEHQYRFVVYLVEIGKNELAIEWMNVLID